MSDSRLTKEQFLEFCKNLSLPENIDTDILFNLFECACDNAFEMSQSKILGKNIPLNYFVILLYLVNEYVYARTTPNFSNNDEFNSMIISITLDKYFTNEHLNYQNNQFTSKFSIEMSTLELYLNLMLGIIKKFPQNNPRETLLVDIANKALKLSKAISSLIVQGFETEAFSTWRTLHETESILTIIAKYGEPVIKSYLKHMNYGIAFRGGIKDKETTDKIFIEIKDEMKALNLKSKDMKKFIEYGWLTSIKDFEKFDSLWKTTTAYVNTGLGSATSGNATALWTDIVSTVNSGISAQVWDKVVSGRDDIAVEANSGKLATVGAISGYNSAFITSRNNSRNY